MRTAPRIDVVTSDALGKAGLALFALCALLPIGFSLGYAAAYSVGWAGLLSEGFTLVHWIRVLGSIEVWGALGWSIYVAGVTVVLTVGAALALAIYLRRPLQYGPLSYVIYFPLALPATVAAFLVFQLFSGAGYVSRLALHLGLVDDVARFPSFLHDPLGIGIITAHVGITVPFFILLFVQVYNNERISDLVRLAQTLGAGRWACLYRVTVPILLVRSRANIILLFIAVLGSFEIPLLLGRQSPEMLSVLTMRKYSMFDLAQKPEAFIVALFLHAYAEAVEAVVERLWTPRVLEEAALHFGAEILVRTVGPFQDGYLYDGLPPEAPAVREAVSVAADYLRLPSPASLFAPLCAG